MEQPGLYRGKVMSFQKKKESTAVSTAGVREEELAAPYENQGKK